MNERMKDRKQEEMNEWNKGTKRNEWIKERNKEHINQRTEGIARKEWKKGGIE